MDETAVSRMAIFTCCFVINTPHKKITKITILHTLYIKFDSIGVGDSPCSLKIGLTVGRHPAKSHFISLIMSGVYIERLTNIELKRQGLI